MGNRQRLATRIALEILEANTFEATGPGGAQDLLGEAIPILRKRVRQMRPATLGIIAASGTRWGSGDPRRTALYQVHCGTYLDKYASGKELLRALVITALVAEMWDILKSRDPQRAAYRHAT